MFLGGLSVGVCVKSTYEINWKYNSSRNEQMEMKICQLKKKYGQIMLKKIVSACTSLHTRNKQVGKSIKVLGSCSRKSLPWAPLSPVCAEGAFMDLQRTWTETTVGQCSCFSLGQPQHTFHHWILFLFEVVRNLGSGNSLACEPDFT